MNKTAIKNYAIWARVQLIESAKQRAFEYEITENGENKSGLDTVGGRLLTKTETEQRDQLIAEINQKGYAQVMEEAAYTWFNRFIALRFMEVNGFLPSKVRVFTDESGAFKPEILKQATTVQLDGLNRSEVIDMLEKQNNEELYKYLLVTQCNALNSGLPYMFEKISDWTELLFPSNLLRQDSIVGQMITEIPEEDWTDAVQIIGWLYQYYNSELKDETFALLKNNVKITKERIPAATQLFTPDWIVRYMVENSLGRLWYEGHKDFDKSEWKYYLDEEEQEPNVEEQLVKIRDEYSQIKPEEIKVIDPCMGSGHVLVYAFDILMQIYTSAGWSERDAAKSILENNLYGLDIDDRAGQLAYFAVMMKARKYNRRILTLNLQPNVMSVQDSSFMTNELIDYIAGGNNEIKGDLKQIKKVFEDAKEYGSMLIVPSLGYRSILDRIEQIQNSFADDLFQISYQESAVEKLLPLIKQAMIMSQKYDAVVTNPPYMGGAGMNQSLSKYVKQHYPQTGNDLSTVYMEKCLEICATNRFVAMINIPVWMFLSSYEGLRLSLLNNYTIYNMIHPGRGIFGSDFGTTTFVLSKHNIKNYTGLYFKLFNKQGEVESNEARRDFFLAKRGRYKAKQDSFFTIPGAPIAYWVPISFLLQYKEKNFLEYFSFKRGIGTGDNNRFLRLWFEVSNGEINGPKWFAYNKGGEYRKWYGNRDYVVNWENEGEAIRNHYKNGRLASRPQNTQYNFADNVSYSSLTMGNLSFRHYSNFVNDQAGNYFIPISDLSILYAMALLNSVVAPYCIGLKNSTLNTTAEDFKAIPLICISNDEKEKVISIAKKCEELSKKDWDSFETSWDYKRHPLI